MQRMVGHALDFWEPDEKLLKTIKRAHDQHRLESPQWREGAEHVIIGERQTGKTTLALEWLTEPGSPERVLVVINEAMAEDLRERIGLPRRDRSIISYRSLVKRGPVAGVEYGIDDALDVLSNLLGLRTRPHLVTVTTDVER